ncbi:tRNA dihydrouridine(20/20a) synthase DusA [Rhodovulum sulfidophilum]|uniref:tRNA dihydrouridine(20/20a) synthase DusA n=1 Tax=Rhodovulum sulfidophilum TaxID=35806 RepID=UPI0019279593|nr:tRNA dihydrouridine(20/20a) synthase DusA [Rhodovulum sulfidophilum]MBL3584483.1 tRNA dihydrouridine(20/20a) synthase DusA [Rhodovulum sulfidophilum]
MADKNIKYNILNASRLSVAPMMDWTDRHCRYFHRLMSRSALLYTEMVTAPALVRGGALHLLDHDPAEHPVAVQLGGSDPDELAEATRLCCAAGYDEVNLNVGCPSDRVQSGAFGAVLMKSPGLVGDCLTAMRAVSSVEVTVKCRIGVDDQEPREVLPAFLETVAAAGVNRVIIHARKAWLQGLSPKENRDVPPLDYALVAEMKRAFPAMHVSVNGGISTLAEAQSLLAMGLDGVMIGRAAYHDPAAILLGADEDLFGLPGRKTARQVAEEMRPYIARHLAAGGRLHNVTRHMLGLFAGAPGARAWRRVLSEGAAGQGAGLEVLDAALSALPRAA